MGYIRLYNVSFTTTPTMPESGVISYRLSSDPDVPGSYTTWGNRLFNPDGSIDGGPVTILDVDPGNYTVKVAFNCGSSFTKVVIVPSPPVPVTSTTSTTSTTTTIARTTVYITGCFNISAGARVLTFSASQNVNTDVQLFFTIAGTFPSTAYKEEVATTFIFNGTNERVTSNGSNWGTITSVTVHSMEPSSSGLYDYVFVGPMTQCGDT